MKTNIVLLAVSLVTASAFAGEPDVTIGVSGGYILPIHSGTFNFTNPEYDTTEIGKTRYSLKNGTGFHSALNGVFVLDNSAQFSLGATVGYSRFPSQSDEPGESYPSRKANGDTVRTTTFYRNEYSQGALAVNLDLRCKLFDDNGLGVQVGASSAYMISNSYRFTYNIIFPDDNVGFPPPDPPNYTHKPFVKDFELRFADENRSSLLLYEGELPDINPLQVSFRAGVFYDITLSGIILSPSVVYHFPLTKVSSSQDWKISQLSFSLDVRFAL